MAEEGEVVTETITISQHWLGMEPYTLIELRPSSQHPEEPALHVEFGGGAENGLMMPLLVVTEHAPEEHPVAEMLRQVYRETGPTSTGESVVEKIVRELNEDWLEFVTGD